MEIQQPVVKIMLEIRPICEHCNKALPPDATDAMICSFECTFCRTCVEDILKNVCPNCGGGFSPRPVRPSNNWRNDNYLGKYPASQKKIYNPVDVDAHEDFCRNIKNISAKKR